MARTAKDLFEKMPDTIETLDFNLNDVENIMIQDILEATANESVQLLCFCSGNRINNDWLVSNKIIYKIPYLPEDEEIHIIEMGKIGEFDPELIVFQDLLNHNELCLCIDLGDNVWILRNLQDDNMEVIDHGQRQYITIPDKSVKNYDANYVREWVIKENPYIFQYKNYSVQLGPGISIKIYKDGESFKISDS